MQLYLKIVRILQADIRVLHLQCLYQNLEKNLVIPYVQQRQVSGQQKIQEHLLMEFLTISAEETERFRKENKE